MLDQLKAVSAPNETKTQKLDALLEGAYISDSNIINFNLTIAGLAVRDFGGSSSLIMYLRLLTSLSLQQVSLFY